MARHKTEYFSATTVSEFHANVIREVIQGAMSSPRYPKLNQSTPQNISTISLTSFDLATLAEQVISLLLDVADSSSSVYWNTKSQQTSRITNFYNSSTVDVLPFHFSHL